MRKVLPITLLFLIPVAGMSYPSSPASSHRLSFQLSIVDSRTGAGVPNVQVIADNRIICYTRSNGTVMWSESSLMDRDVHFRIKSGAFQHPDAGATLHVARGGRAVLNIQP